MELKELKKVLEIDWDRFPSLYIFLSLLSGVFLSFKLLFPLFISLTHKKHSHVFGFIILSLFSASLYWWDPQKTPLENLGNVKGYLIPENIKRNGDYIHLQGTLIEFSGNKKIKVALRLNENKKPKIDGDFLFFGDLTKSNFRYFLQPKILKKIPYSFSFVEMRYNLKEKIRNILKQNIKNQDVFEYFSALVTGEISSYFLKNRFSENGLLHVLAISGFHFSWIVFLFSIPFTLIFPRKIAFFILLLFSWGYMLFLGNSASVIRAGIAITVYLSTLLLSKTPVSLNAFGVAGIISIIINPDVVFELGFILSFAATFCILTLHGVVTKLSCKLCEIRNYQRLSLMNHHTKIIYFLLRFFSVSFCLTMLITFSLIPILSNYFPMFTLRGIFFNLFFPISMIPTLVFLIFGFLVSYKFFFLAEFISKIFLHSILYSSSLNPMLIRAPVINLLLQSFLFLLFVLTSLFLEKKYFNEVLSLKDEYY